MKNVLKVFGYLSSLGLWSLGVWAAMQPEKTKVHWIIIAAVALTLFIHFLEVALLMTDEDLKPQATAKNAIFTILFGAFHFMPLYKEAKLDKLP